MDSDDSTKAPVLTGPDGQISERSTRQWLWVVAQVGEPRALEAIGQLGARRPYPLNIAKVMGLNLPPEDQLPPTPEMHQRYQDARARMRELLAKYRAGEHRQ